MHELYEVAYEPLPFQLKGLFQIWQAWEGPLKRASSSSSRRLDGFLCHLLYLYLKLIICISIFIIYRVEFAFHILWNPPCLGSHLHNPHKFLPIYEDTNLTYFRRAPLNETNHYRITIQTHLLLWRTLGKPITVGCDNTDDKGDISSTQKVSSERYK